jgi:hypothetical protein
MESDPSMPLICIELLDFGKFHRELSTVADLFRWQPCPQWRIQSPLWHADNSQISVLNSSQV